MVEKDIARMMVFIGDVIFEEDDEIYKKGDSFKRFHHQTSQPMSQKALLAGFLSIWLKKCMVSSPPHDRILPLVLFPAVQLASDDRSDCFPQ